MLVSINTMMYINYQMHGPVLLSAYWIILLLKL